MKKTLHFTVQIAAPRVRVWDAMLGPDTYRDWTSAFTEGSYYEGSWDQGARITFLDPSGNGGMIGEIAENRRHEFVSIRMLGEIADGVEDTTSEKVRAWVPAYENYTFRDHGRGTEVTVDVDVIPEYEEFIAETFPKALARLKAICEDKAEAARG